MEGEQFKGAAFLFKQNKTKPHLYKMSQKLF